MICLCEEKAVWSLISMSLHNVACGELHVRWHSKGARSQLTHIKQEASVSPWPVKLSLPTAMTPELWHAQTTPTLIHVITFSELTGCIWLKPVFHNEVGWDRKWFTMQIWHNHNSGSAPLWKQRRRRVKNWCGLFYQAERKKKRDGRIKRDVVKEVKEKKCLSVYPERDVDSEM